MNSTFTSDLIACFQKHLGGNFLALVLFGSRARNGARPESDYDIFLLVRNLLESPVERLLYVRHAIALQFSEKIALLARTPEDFERGFPSLYLDLGLDGVVLYDSQGYMVAKLRRIQKIIAQAGLLRKKLGEQMNWDRQIPPQGPWEITWEGGYRELRA